MAKNKVTVTVDPVVLADADADAAAAGVNRSVYVEQALRNEHYRRLMAHSTVAPLTEADEQQIKQVLAWQHTLDAA